MTQIQGHTRAQQNSVTDKESHSSTEQRSRENRERGGRYQDFATVAQRGVMTAPDTALPSVSSLLKWARGEVLDHDGNPANPVASNEQPRSEVAGEALPVPLTDAIIKCASEELPQGATVALESCVTAYKSKRLSEAEFLAFTRSLGWQSAALAEAFHAGRASSEAMMSGGQLATIRGMEHLDAKRQRLAMPSNVDTTATAHALMALNEASNHTKVSQWDSGALTQLPSLQQLLMQGHPDALQQSALRGPAQSSSSTPSPHTRALQRMYAAADFAHAPASLSQSRHTDPVPSLSDSRDVLDVKVEVGISKDASSSSPSSPSTPPSRPAQADTSASKASTARVVMEGVAKSNSAQCASGGAVQAEVGGGVGGVATLLNSPDDSSAHNKYCHFCQHIKVKRASSMIACENRGCNRRFCDHCLSTHIADQSYTLQWRASGLPWHCPICTKSCCCTLGDCSKTHRHCKAYRYRRKRAQLAENDFPLPSKPSLASHPSYPGNHPALTLDQQSSLQLMISHPHMRLAGPAAVYPGGHGMFMRHLDLGAHAQGMYQPHQLMPPAAAGAKMPTHMFF